MNRPVIVSTLYDCNDLDKDDVSQQAENPSWHHNMIGCCVIRFLQHMYHVNVSYMIGPVYRYSNTSIDVYASPQIINSDIMAVANPVQTVLLWRFGFVFRRSDEFKFNHRYYSRPFTKHVWDSLIAMACIVAILFYLISWWEKRWVGGNVECNIGLEVLLIIGGYCQHIFPVETYSCSRRAAHFSFFLYAYIIYTVYTSNLLSHLVNDKENDITLADLINSDFEFVTFPNMKQILHYEYASQNITSFQERLAGVKEMDIAKALEAVRVNKTAFLSDYMYIYPIVKRRFSDKEVCNLMSIDVIADVRKYIFASKHFRYIEQLKIGTLRAKEAGIIKRMTSQNPYQPIKCDSILHQEVGICHISIPLLILISTFALSFIIMIIERIHFRRNTSIVYPYIE